MVAEARGPRSLKVYGSSLDKLKRCKWWNRIEELEIYVFHDVEEKEIRSALSAAAALRSLRLRFGTISGPSSPDEKISMPLLTHLELQSVHHLWPIDCPNLTHLSLHSPFNIFGLEIRRIHLPHLRELSFSATEFPENALRVFDIPPLHRFDFHCSLRKLVSANILNTLWDDFKPSGPREEPLPFCMEPEIFSITNTLVNLKVLARVLAYRVFLQELHMTAMEITSEPFEALLPVQPLRCSKRARRAWYITCPTLKRIVIDFAGHKVKQERGILEASARKLVVARSKVSAPFERFTMRYSENKFVELV